MATYYVDAVNGLDANNGLGPDASHATNKPWKTIAKLLGAAGMASGDTAYLSPAGPFRERVTVAMTSATGETSVIGDPSNAQGFKTSGGVLVAPGEVRWTCYDTNDLTLPGGTGACLILAGRDYLTFQYITFIGGTSSPCCVDGTTLTSTNIQLLDCGFFVSGSNAGPIQVTAALQTALNWTISRCVVMAFSTACIAVGSSSSAAAGDNWDLNFLIQNCLLIGGGSNSTGTIQVSGSAGGTVQVAGGVDIFNCTLVSGAGLSIRIANDRISTSIPCTMYNCVCHSGGLSATTLGQLVEDYNIISAATPRTNVAAGTNSISDFSRAMGVHAGQEFFYGGRLRFPFEPTSWSGVLGFGAQAGGPSVDLLNITRPKGGGSLSYAAGAMERHNTAAQETSVTDAGSNAIKIVGPGDQEIEIPVSAAATVITVRCRYDTNHGTGSKPQATLLANGEIGVTAETVTAAAAVDTWETLTFASQTPSRAGVVKIRLISRSAAAGGIAYFDTVTGGASGSQGLDYFNRTEPFGAAVAAGSSGGGSIFASPVIT